ncbi:hypothetical protein JCM33374_g2179 [Metschnikowia sp. JCM 33374]|nr:hypothetical protein JCM33374_g2179 [Metschnikowia sp. JCM 33374]
MDIASLLETALMSPDATTRNTAERQLSELATHSFREYMTYLADILVSDAKSQVRILAALGMKNQLTSKDSRKKQDQQVRWITLDHESKAAIKTNVTRVLLGNDRDMTTSISQTEQPVNVKRSCLLAIGYICESADANDPQILAQSNGILIAIVQGVQSTEPSVQVRLTALNALIYSLQFIKINFQREGERNFIMQVVCEATQAEDPELQAAAFACLARIVQLYYQHMSLYMEKALYALSINGMQSPNDNVACMAIEFWSTICEEEFEIAFQLHEYNERGEQASPDLISYNFSLLGCRDVLPVLLTLLTKQNEDPEDDDWSVAMAAGSCLQLFATTTGAYVVEPTLTFFAANIGSPEWRNREAAVMAFGSILEGPEVDQLKQAIQEAVKPILALISDPTIQVKETVTWCLGKITEVAINALEFSNDLEPLLQALLLGLNDHPKVSVNCCWALMNLLEQLCADSQSQDTSVMSKYYHTFVPALVQLSGKEDNEFNSRASAYEALSAFVSYSANDSMPIIQQIATEVLSRLEATISMQSQSFGSEGKASLEELQINLLSLLTTTIRRLSNEVQGAADNLMTLFIKLLVAQEPNALIEEDIFIAISAVSGAVGPDFLKYMDTFVPYLTKALRNVQSPTCVIAVGFVADLAQSLGHAIAPFLDGLMAILGEDLNDKDVPYMDVVMRICSELANIAPEDSSYDSLEFTTSVKEAVLDCYVGIVSSLSTQPQQLFGYLEPIYQLIEQISGDVEMSTNESTARSAVGLLGDIAAMYSDGQLKNYYEQPWVTSFIKKTRSNITFTQQTKDAARWARDRQKRQIG